MNATQIAACANLDSLLAAILSVELPDDDMSDLPTFGGDEQIDTCGVWSWDETRLIVGTCRDDFRIIDREDA